MVSMIASFAIGAGAAADPDPRANPESVPQDRVLWLGERIPQTDAQPASLALALEGTAGNTCGVVLFASYDDPQRVTPANQRWYQLNASAITVTVGSIVRAPAIPGRIYVRVTTASAAASTLKAMALSVPYATPVS